jgi:DNA (cytosine-5)-methyltransferase 1
VSGTAKIKTLSLFSGAGGLDIGFSQAGYDVVGCVEIESAYCQTLTANSGRGKLFRDAHVNCIDIREFDPTPYVGIGIECVIGGPPCQTFSAAGRRSGGVLGTIDARGRLFESYCRILKEIRPKVFVFENVYGLPGANDGQPWREICKAFSDLGYSMRAEVVDSADYGVPQHRERLIIVGYKGGVDDFVFPEPTHGPDSSSGRSLVSVFDAISDLQNEEEPYHEFDGLYGHLLSLVPEGLNYSFFTREMGYPKPFFAWRSKFHDFLYKVDRQAPARTIKAQPGKFTGPFHWKNRHFSVEELKRLQSFPDDYEIVGKYGKIVEQIGNSVPPLLAKVIAVSVREQLLRRRERFSLQVRKAGFESTFKKRQRERTNHYKDVAKAEVSKRFPNVVSVDFSSIDHIEKYYVRYKGNFTKHFSSDMEEGELGDVSYSVNERREGNSVLVDIGLASIKARGAKSISIAISGLSKYLLSVDTLKCNAEVSSLDDLFRVWSIIEAVLIKGSQFYTLIDIYGHYANRGDTVKVETFIKARKKSALVRAIEFFGSSENAGIFMTQDVVAHEMNIDKASVTDLVAELRSLRWDVRSPKTHPTIRQDAVICTYPFPLLSGKAQLERKVDLG